MGFTGSEAHLAIQLVDAVGQTQFQYIRVLASIFGFPSDVDVNESVCTNVAELIVGHVQWNGKGRSPTGYGKELENQCCPDRVGDEAWD